MVVKCPRSVHDVRILKNSPSHKTIVEGDDAVPVCILGVPADPLLPNLMEEFSDGSRHQQSRFGYRMVSSIIVIECTFSGLKGRIMDISLDLSNAIFVCFVLYNYCEVHVETLSGEKLKEACSYEREFQPPTCAPGYGQAFNETSEKHIRQIFTEFFDQGHLMT